MGLFSSKKRKEQEALLLETEEYVFRIEDITYHKNNIVTLGGRMIKGSVHVGDRFLFNGVEYVISGLARGPEPNAEIAQDLYCGLIIRYKTTGIYKTIFKLGAVKIIKANSVVTSTRRNDAPPPRPAPPSASQKKEFSLGTFSFTEADRQKIKATASRYMPENLQTPTAQLQILEYLSAVMHIDVAKQKTESFWKIPDEMPSELKKERSTFAFVQTILAINQSLGFLNPEFLIKKVDLANAEELLKAWIVLDFYAKALKPEHTINIQHFRDYIHNTIQTKFANTNNANTISPVKFNGTNILVDSLAFLQWRKANVLTPQFEVCASLPLTVKEPMITLYEDGIKTREYCLQTENDEDFTGKYFLISVRLGFLGNPAVPIAQIDGFVSDTPENRKMTPNDIGYRMEGHFLAFGGEEGKRRYAMNRGQNLVMKALKYPGYTTPTNTRLMGICPDCGKSFCFHGYAFYMGQSDVAYSDDGLDCCEIQAYNIDKNSWTYETEGKTFRYYNSFNCPHCGTPYIDYKKHPENKTFGVSGCVHLGRKHYRAE